MAIDFDKMLLDKCFMLYHISYLSSNWYYTDADHAITYNTHVYTPATIKHGDIIKDSELNKIQLEINAPVNDLAKKFVAFAPPATVLVTLYLYAETTPPTSFIAFVGELTKISLGQNNACSIMIDEYTVLSTKLPKLLIQPACNHVLFDTGCELVKNDYKVSALIDGISANMISSHDFAIYPNTWFTQGIMEFEGDMRFISQHNGSGCLIQMGFYDLEIGDTVFVYPGCDKAPATCRDKFSNLDNYLGCPYVPRKNPVLWGL